MVAIVTHHRDQECEVPNESILVLISLLLFRSATAKLVAHIILSRAVVIVLGRLLALTVGFHLRFHRRCPKIRRVNHFTKALA